MPVISIARATLLAWLAASALAIAASTPAPALPHGIAQTASVEGITEYALDNGLRVLLFPDISKPTVTINVTYLVGSRHEPYGETGMAHLLEHMMFKGTPRYGNIFQALSARGMDFNGTTWFDRTNYYETFPASDDSLRWALAMEADRMVHSTIAKRDLDSEMPVVRNEMEEGENNPAHVLTEKVQAAAYQWHNYSRSTIGARSDVEGADIAHLQAFYRKYYQPDNAVLLIAGHFDPGSALAWVAREFGPIARPRRNLEPTHTLDPVQDGEREVVLRRVGNIQLVQALYHIVPGGHPQYPAFEILATILGDTPSGRLHRALVESGKASGVFADTDALYDPGFIIFGAQVREDSPLAAAKEALLATIEGIAAQPITALEFDRARVKLLKDIDLALNDPQQLGIALSEDIAAGDWRLFFLFRDRVRAMTLDDVQRAAESYLKRSNRTLGLFVPEAHPDRAPEPVRVDVGSAARDYRGGTAVAPGEAFAATTANIEARTVRGALVNGMRYAMLPKRTRGHTVTVVWHIYFGDERTLQGRAPAGTLTASLLTRGTARRTRQEIEDALDRYRMSLSISGSETHAVVSLETVREHLPDALRLVAEILRQPAFPPAEFEQLRSARLASLEAEHSDPQSLADEALYRYGNPYPRGDVRYVESLDEQIAALKAVKLAQVQSFYRDFYGASDGRLAVVGDFDPAQMKSLLAKLFGDWKSPRPYARVPTPYYAVPGAHMDVLVAGKSNAVLVAHLALPLSDTDPDYPALLVGNYILGGWGSSRLMNRVRQADGISYTVGSSITPDAFEANSSFGLYAIFAPQNRGRLETALDEEIRGLLRDGVRADEVRDAAAALAQERQLALTQDLSLAGLLARNLHLARTMTYTQDIDQAIAQISVDRVNQSLRKYIRPDDFVTTCAGSFPAKTP
jgi:zinc protease